MANVDNSAATTKKLGGVTGKGWKPGQSGNPGGRPKTRYISEALRELLESGDAEQLAKILVKLGKKSSQQVAAIREIIHTTEGTPKQRIEHTGADGGPLAHTISFVNRKKRDADD